MDKKHSASGERAEGEGIGSARPGLARAPIRLAQASPGLPE